MTLSGAELARSILDARAHQLAAFDRHRANYRRIPPMDLDALPNFCRSGDVVYFLQAGVTGLVKIGTTIGLRRRVMNLRAASPVSLDLLAVEIGSYADEGHYHDEFRDLRRHGEWFEPAPRLLDRIADIRRIK